RASRAVRRRSGVRIHPVAAGLVTSYLPIEPGNRGADNIGQAACRSRDPLPTIDRVRAAHRIAVLATISALVVASAPSADGAGHAWFTSWAQSQDGHADAPVSGQSLRMITHLSQGGDAVRVRLQNTFGTGPLTVDH